METAIIIGIIVIAILIIGLVVYINIKRKLRNFSQAIFGTDSLMEGWNNQQEQLADQPKSVSAITSLALGQISEDFPEFSYSEFKQKAELVLKDFTSCISSKKELTCDNASPNLKKQAASQIESLSSQDLTEIYDNFMIHRTEISKYINQNGVATILFQSSCQSTHYVRDNLGRVKRGNKDLKSQEVYEIELNHIQDVNKIEQYYGEDVLGMTCPNCGAPIKTFGKKFCEYCGSGIKDINVYSWNFNRISLVK